MLPNSTPITDGTAGNGGTQSHADTVLIPDSIPMARRPPSPESPKPYVPADRSRTSFFRAPDAPPTEPLYAQDLVRYARDFNKTQDICRLHLWEKTRERREAKPRMMRFTISDILIAYISLGYSSVDNAALVHTVTCFGARERVSFLFAAFLLPALSLEWRAKCLV